MINLLPPEYAKEIRAAYSNSLLFRYTILLFIACVFLVGVFILGWIYLTNIGHVADANKQENERQAAGYIQTQSAATALRQDLSSAKKLFDNDLSYSSIIVRLSGLLPPGTALSELTLSKDSLTQPMKVSVLLKGEKEAEGLLGNLRSSPYITTVSVDGFTSNPNNTAFPYTASLSITLNRSIAQ